MKGSRLVSAQLYRRVGAGGSLAFRCPPRADLTSVRWSHVPKTEVSFIMYDNINKSETLDEVQRLRQELAVTTGNDQLV